jgi:hypothetical protein
MVWLLQRDSLDIIFLPVLACPQRNVLERRYKRKQSQKKKSKKLRNDPGRQRVETVLGREVEASRERIPVKAR